MRMTGTLRNVEAMSEYVGMNSVSSGGEHGILVMAVGGRNGDGVLGLVGAVAKI